MGPGLRAPSTTSREEGIGEAAMERTPIQGSFSMRRETFTALRCPAVPTPALMSFVEIAWEVPYSSSSSTQTGVGRKRRSTVLGRDQTGTGPTEALSSTKPAICTVQHIWEGRTQAVSCTNYLRILMKPGLPDRDLQHTVGFRRSQGYAGL